MATEPNSKSKAWAIYDRIVMRAAARGVHSNPWVMDQSGVRHFEPDYDTLRQLLGVPLFLRATTQSGVPALALDVWLSYELRRAGFGTDQTWPRPSHPRVLPASVSKLLDALPRTEADLLRARMARLKTIKGVISASAPILGKNYLKQVDVVITDWNTGPELLISTKRMDSSFTKNAPNRIEESYGDAKNLRLRHPLAALGFMFGLRTTIFNKEAKTAEWLFDLLVKLGREDDAYHATCLVLMDYASDNAVVENGEGPAEGAVIDPGEDPDEEEDEDPAPLANAEIDRAIAQLPSVQIRLDMTPSELMPERFLAAIVNRVLEATPVAMHREARKRRLEAVPR